MRLSRLAAVSSQDFTAITKVVRGLEKATEGKWIGKVEGREVPGRGGLTEIDIRKPHAHDDKDGSIAQELGTPLADALVLDYIYEGYKKVAKALEAKGYKVVFRHIGLGLGAWRLFVAKPEAAGQKAASVRSQRRVVTLGELVRVAKAQPKQPEACPRCKKFFAKYRCNKPGECDCPKCQNTCTCSKGK